MIFRRKKESFRFWQLATYNAERSRGLVHSPEWMERMVKEQVAFNLFYGRQPVQDPVFLPGYDGMGGIPQRFGFDIGAEQPPAEERTNV